MTRRILDDVLNSDYSGQNCSVARTLEVVGERWTLLIVRELLRRPCRFADLEQGLGIAKNVLAARLEKLLDRGIVDKRPYSSTHDRNEYRLTAKGRDLFYVIDALMAWGDAHASPDGPPVVIEHSCGQPTGYRVHCESCGEQVTPRNVSEVPGPGARALSSS